MSFVIATCRDPECPDAEYEHEYGPGCRTFRRMWECVCGMHEISHIRVGEPFCCPRFTPKWTMPESDFDRSFQARLARAQAKLDRVKGFRQRLLDAVAFYSVPTFARTRASKVLEGVIKELDKVLSE